MFSKPQSQIHSILFELLPLYINSIPSTHFSIILDQVIFSTKQTNFTFFLMKKKKKDSIRIR